MHVCSDKSKDPTIKAVSEPPRDFNCTTAVTSNKLCHFSLLNDDATDHLHSPSQSGKFQLSFKDEEEPESSTALMMVR